MKEYNNYWISNGLKNLISLEGQDISMFEEIDEFLISINLKLTKHNLFHFSLYHLITYKCSFA